MPPGSPVYKHGYTLDVLQVFPSHDNTPSSTHCQCIQGQSPSTRSRSMLIIRDPPLHLFPIQYNPGFPLQLIHDMTSMTFSIWMSHPIPYDGTQVLSLVPVYVSNGSIHPFRNPTSHLRGNNQADSLDRPSHTFSTCPSAMHSRHPNLCQNAA